jgi:hypothetical protein
MKTKILASFTFLIEVFAFCSGEVTALAMAPTALNHLQEIKNEST